MSVEQTFEYGVLALWLLTSAYGVAAMVGHALGIKDYQDHPPIVVPAVVAAFILMTVITVYLLGLVVVMGLRII